MISEKELNLAIKGLNNRETAGLGDILIEQIKYLKQSANNWLFDFFNKTINTYQIPKIWRKEKIIALPKPGKDPDDPKSYYPVSFLGHQYKLFERLILNRLDSIVYKKFFKERAGFRPGKPGIC